MMAASCRTPRTVVFGETNGDGANAGTVAHFAGSVAAGTEQMPARLRPRFRGPTPRGFPRLLPTMIPPDRPNQLHPLTPLSGSHCSINIPTGLGPGIGQDEETQ